MDFFFSPLACSLAGRIAIYDAGAEDRFTLRSVDIRTKQLSDGSSYLSINSMGQVPALRIDDGRILTENSAILLYIADQLPHARLVPAEGFERYEVIRWLSFVGSELHMRVFKALVSSKPNEGAQSVARIAAGPRLAYLDDHLTDREFLSERFGVADAALVAVLNWARYIRFDLSLYPAVAGYRDRMETRPAVARALRDEL